MSDIKQKIYDSLNKAPVYLFLGQDYLKLETGRDSLLDEILKKYNKEEYENPSYYNIFEGDAKKSKRDALAWIQNRCERISIPDWVKSISDFPWSGVYTSAIDIIWVNAFRKDWRDIQPILEERYNPSDPHNRHNLHCTFLFGRIDRDDYSETVPLDYRELRKRKQVARKFLDRLPEIITPFGLLMIEGYNSDLDWLPLEDLLSTVVEDLLPNQVHIFSCNKLNKSSKDNEYVRILVDEKKLVLHDESLAKFLLDGQEKGLLKYDKNLEDKAYGRKIQLDNMSFTIPIDCWNQVSRSASILDDTCLLPVKPLSPDAQYREFRRFLSESGTFPIWSGYARGFAFRREFEKELKSIVDKRLKQKDLNEEPILLVGQTGTGKTIALGHLAYKVRKEGKYPVLFIEGKTKKPLNTEIDAFCQWIKSEWELANKLGTPTVLIIWDENDNGEQYYRLLRYLAGRGHRVVLVGSSYKQEAEKAFTKDFNVVEAPAQLTEIEIDNFSEFLDQFEESLGQQVKQYIGMSDNSFLVALYRLLPATRALIRSGVIKEYGQAEKNLKKATQEKVNNNIEEDTFQGTLHYAMIQANLVENKYSLSEEKQVLGGEELTESQQLMGLIMVPGSYKLRIPIELLLRTLNKNKIKFFSELLAEFDIFNWNQDNVGNITIGPRQTLEAKIWVSSAIGGPKYEVDYANKLLFNIKDTGNYYDNPEVQFAVDLVRFMGPNNLKDSYKFRPYLINIAETLGDLRTKRNILNPRLMLQEATLLREYIKEQSQAWAPPSNAEQLLDEAEEILHKAIELLGPEPKNKSIMLGELASIHGTRFIYNINAGIGTDELIEYYKKAREASLRAWSTDTENYIPIDILGWTTENYLDKVELPEEQRFETEADILHIFELAELEKYAVLYEEAFQKRRFNIGKLLSKKGISEDAFNRLKEIGSSAGYYLRAQEMISNIPHDEELTYSQKELCAKAAYYLEEYRDKIENDYRVLYLLLKLWWMSKTGKPLFFGERQVIPFTVDDWLYCQKIVSSLLNYEVLSNNPRLLFLKGLAVFHCNEAMEAFEIFKQLSREADHSIGKRRIIRSYLASLPDGQPMKFTGEVSWISNDATRGEVRISEIRQNVHFSPREFNKPEIRRGQTLGNFHLAFNFLGPSADPIGNFRVPRKRKK